MRKLPSGNSASDSLSMLTRPFDACGRSGKPFAAWRMPSGSSPVSDCPAASVSRMVSVSVAATLLALRNRHGCRVVERREGDEELVDPCTIVARAGDVVAAVGQHIKRALIAGGRSRPRFRIDRNGGAGAERLPELVAQIGRQPSNPDERLVDEGEIA